MDETSNAGSSPVERKVSWQKACKCVGSTARTGALRFSQQWEDGEIVREIATYIPGPSCDQCGTAWELLPVNK